MGVLTVAFVASPEDVPRFEGGPEPHSDVLKGLGTIELSALGQLALAGSLDWSDEESYGPTYDELDQEINDTVHTFSSEEEWVFHVPERLTRALAELPDDRLPELVDAWSLIEEFDWQTVEDLREYLRELRSKAVAARDTQKQVYLWMSL